MLSIEVESGTFGMTLLRAALCSSCSSSAGSARLSCLPEWKLAAWRFRQMHVAACAAADSGRPAAGAAVRQAARAAAAHPAAAAARTRRDALHRSTCPVRHLCMHPQGTQGPEEAFILSCSGAPSAIEWSQVYCSKA